jgi:hypothetical protein
VTVDTPLDQAWATLSHLAPARIKIAGHAGVLRLEVADDDTHTATFRLRTLAFTAALTAAGAGTRLDVAPELPHAFTATLAAALTRPGPLPRLVRA